MPRPIGATRHHRGARWVRAVAAVANGMVLLATMTTGAGGSAPPFLRPGSSPTGPPIPLRPFIQLWAAAPLADVPSASSRPAIPRCRYGDEPAAHVAYKDWATTLVDTAFSLPPDYEPPDLVPVSQAGLPGTGLVRGVVIDNLRAMANAARRAGAPLAVVSAYRSEALQRAVFAGWVAASGLQEALRFSARPGHSEHQLGTALDLGADGARAPWEQHFSRTARGRWVTAHAWEFGFLVSYTPGARARTCYSAEAWHVRYVGRAEARAVHESGLTLREWLWRNAN